MSNFKVCVYSYQFKDAPNEPSLRVIGSFIAGKEYITEVNELVPFMEQVGSKGCTLCPSTFKDGIKSTDTFEQSQLLTLSFDSFSSPDNQDVTFEKIKARAERYNLPILFAYDSYSYWTRRRFNIAFLNETPLYDFREAEAMQRALMMIFPEADRDCSVLKVYRGGKKLLHFTEAMPTINAEWLFMNMCLYLKDGFGPTNYKRKIAEFSRETGVRLDDRSLPDVSIAEVHTEYHIEKIDDKNSSKCIIEERSDEILSHHECRINFESGSTSEERAADHERSPTISPRGSDVLKSFSSSCRLYQEFESGSRRLTQQELLGLATNLSQVKSG